jgi:hypothetical protein
MAIDRSAIQKGMTVYGADGERVGTVIQPPPALTPGVDPVTFGMTEAERQAEAERIRVGAFEVEDPGFLGVGAGGLHVPLSAVLTIDSSGHIILNCTRDEARERYGPPPSLRFDPSGPPPP